MTTSGRSWRKRKRERPEEIRAAAMVEFLRVGFESATMTQIAIRAGVTKGTIYLYYASKQTLREAASENAGRIPLIRSR